MIEIRDRLTAKPVYLDHAATSPLRPVSRDALAAHAGLVGNPAALHGGCAQCGIPPLDRHTAAGDTFTTAELFLFLCARLRSRLARPLLARDLPIAI